MSGAAPAREAAPLLSRLRDAVLADDADLALALTTELHGRLHAAVSGFCHPGSTLTAEVAAWRVALAHISAAIDRRQASIEARLSALADSHPGLRTPRASQVYGAHGRLLAPSLTSRGCERA